MNGDRILAWIVGTIVVGSCVGIVAVVYWGLWLATQVNP